MKWNSARRVAACALASAALPCLAGCYAAAVGIAVGVVAGNDGGGSSSTPTFEVANVIPELSATVVLPESCGIQISGIQSIPELEPFATGDLRIAFDLARTDKPAAAGRAKLTASVYVDRLSGEEEIRSYELSGEAGGKNVFFLPTRDLELRDRERIRVAIRPEDGRGKEGSTSLFPVDNRSAAPGGTLCFCSESCSIDLTGQVRCRWSLSGSAPTADPESVRVFIVAEGRVPEFVETRTVSTHSPEDCCESQAFDFTTMWDSNSDSFARRSEDIFPILVVGDMDGLSRPAVLTAECRRLDNTAPKLLAVEVRSDPEAAVGERLVGRVFIDFNVQDQGGEDVDLDLIIRLPRGVVLELPGSEARHGWTITEALGAPSEGARDLETSAEFAGKHHRFVWNSAADIERLVRQGDLESDFLKGLSVSFDVTVRNVGSCLQSETVELESLVLDNSLTHSLAGLIPGQTEPGSASIAAARASFVDLSSMATDESKRFLFIADKDTHTIWKLDFSEIDPVTGAGDITRITGGRNRVRDDADDPEQDVLLTDALLNGPEDIAVSRDANELFFVEKSGALSRIDLITSRLQAILTKAVLNRPLGLCLEELDGRRFIYVADTLNCRVLRVDLSASGVNDVSRITVILGDETRIDLAASLGVDYPITNGCNSAPPGVEPPKPEVCRREFGKSPVGLAIWPTEPKDMPGTQRRFLFVSEPLANRILRIDLGPADAPDETPFPSRDAQVVLENSGSTCPDVDSGNLLAGPRTIRIVGDYLYIASDGVKIGTTARGIVIRSRIVEEGGVPELEAPEFVAGTVKKPTPTADLRCGCSDSSESNYIAEHECGLADEVPLGNPTAVVEDFRGNLYVCDRFNQRTWKLTACDANGIPGTGRDRLATFIGGTVAGRNVGETFLGLEESISVTEGENCFLSPVGEGVTREGTPAREPASGAGGSKLSNPSGMCFLDDTTFLIADALNDRIRRLDSRTGLITTLAGTERDATQRERCMNFFGDGDGVLATDALLHGPRAVAVFPSFRPRAGDRSTFACDPARAVFVVDQLNHMVRKIDAKGEISTFAGSGVEGVEAGDCATEVRPPKADFPNFLLGFVAAPPTSVFLKFPRGLLVDSSGRVFMGDCRQRILMVNPEGTELRRVVGRGRDFVSLDNLDHRGVQDRDFIRRCQETPDETERDMIGDGGDPLDAILANPGDMVFDREEKFLYFADLGNNRIRRVGPYRKNLGTFEGGTIETVAGNGKTTERVFEGVRDPTQMDLSQPYGLDIDYQTDPPLLYFATETGSKLYRMTIFEDVTANRVELVAGGDIRGSVGDGNPPSKVRFKNPTSLRLDRFGHVYVVDSRNHRIRRFLPPAPGPELVGR